VEFLNSNGAFAVFEPNNIPEEPFNAPPFNRYVAAPSSAALYARDGFFGTYGVNPTAVPEPGTLTLLAMGGLLICMLGAGRRRRATAS
jgi:hypothetical protein